MTSILTRYLGINLLRNNLLALLTLLAISIFFSLVEEFGDTGQGKYGILQAITYVLLLTPRLIYELLPIASIIGSITTLGVLSNNGELAMLRVSGMSQFKLARIFIEIGILFVVLTLIIGEWLMPISMQKAKTMRSTALITQSNDTLWLRSGDNFINIKKILPNNKLEDIYIYEIDKNNELTSILSSKTGEYSKTSTN